MKMYFLCLIFPCLPVPFGNNRIIRTGNRWKIIRSESGSGSSPNLNSSSSLRTQAAHQISSDSVHNFLRYPAHRQTKRKTSRKAAIGRRASNDFWPLIWVNLVLSTYEIAIESVNPCMSKGALNGHFSRTMHSLTFDPWLSRDRSICPEAKL